jgi:hypothetical protein
VGLCRLGQAGPASGRPGIILTPLARDETSGPGTGGYRKAIEVSAAGRVSTTHACLPGPDAGFITGTDLLIDGGVIAALRAGGWHLAMRPDRGVPTMSPTGSRDPVGRPT